MRSISSFASWVEPLMVIFCSLPVSLSFAVTVKMPLASMSKRHFDLRRPARRWLDAFEAEVAESAVIARQFTLALQHVNVHGRLVVFSRGEGFRLARRNGRVAFDQLGHHPAERF